MKGKNMENKKLLIIMSSIILVYSLCAQGSTQKPKDCKAEEQATSNKDQFDLSNFDSSNCSEIKFIFKVWHDEKFDATKYSETAKQFLELASLCQQTEKNDLASWDKIFDILGEPFKSIVPMVRDKQGINGNLNIQVKDDIILFEASINYDDDSYDKEAWKNLVDKCVSLAKNEQWLDVLAPIFNDVIRIASDKSGIHGSLDIKLESK